MKRNIKFYRRDRSIKYRGKYCRGRDGKICISKRKWLSCLVFPIVGKQRRAIEHRQIIEYLKTDNEDVFFAVPKGVGIIDYD